MDLLTLIEQFISQWWTIAVATLIIFSVYSWGIAPFRVLKNAFDDKVPGPTALPFIGNMLDAVRHKGQMHLQIDEYYKRYGDVFGIYLLGSLPTLVISDLDMVKEVFVKKFQAFRDRPLMVKFPEPYDKMLSLAEGEDWRRIRNTLSPTFSAHKMKQMVPLMNSACDTLMIKMEEFSRTEESFDVMKYFQGLTMDVILQCAFGMKADAQNNPDDPAITAAKRSINGTALQRAILAALSLIPFRDKIAKVFPSLLTRDMKDLMDIARHIVSMKNQTESSTPRKDLLDVMLLAAQDPTLPDSKKMTVDEVLAQSVIFLIAGYETSSTTLGFVCYSLATNADIQEKLQKEIDSVWDDESKMPSYETVNELPYLDMVISETLRLYPAAPFSIRTCKEDCILKNLKVPLGISVTVPTYSIHRDSKLWPNPERFDPERFSPEAKQSRDPYAYMPFGHGPRNCIGMRFAQMEMKLMLVRILKKYSFHVSKDTKIPPEVTLRIALTAKEIKLLIKLRQ